MGNDAETKHHKPGAAPDHIDQEPTAPAHVPGRANGVKPSTGKAPAWTPEYERARSDYETSAVAAEMHAQIGICDVSSKLRSSAPRAKSNLPWWFDNVRHWIFGTIGSRAARSWEGTRAKAEAMRPAHDAIDDMRGERRMSATEAATGIPVRDVLINVKPEAIKSGVMGTGTAIRTMIVHSQGATENLNERDAEFVESLRELIASSFAWIRRHAPDVHGWDAAQLRAAADVLSGPDHSPDAYKADILARLESYRASKVDEIGDGQEMYGKSKIHLTSVSRADGAQRWAVVEWFEPNPDFPVKGAADGHGGVKIVPSTTPKLISWPDDPQDVATGIAYQRNRNKTPDNPDGHVKAIEAFDPPTGDATIDKWRSETSIGEAARGGATKAAGAEPTIDTSKVPVP